MTHVKHVKRGTRPEQTIEWFLLEEDDTLYLCCKHSERDHDDYCYIAEITEKGLVLQSGVAHLMCYIPTVHDRIAVYGSHGDPLEEMRKQEEE